MRAATTPFTSAKADTCHIIIIGAGMAGLCMGAHLKQAGIESFIIVEKAPTPGGTWRDNTYPGAACDTPSHLYSYSFAPKPDWFREFSQQPELQRYLEHVTEQFGLYTHIRFNTEVTEARYDEAACLWTVRTTSADIDGPDTITAPFLIGATGMLSRPFSPEIKNLSTFPGEVFHSARWRHDVPLNGKHVAVIGTGASAIQLIPQIAPLAASVTVFQRNANWMLPLNGHAYSPLQQSRFKRMPWTARAHRWLQYLQYERYFRGLLTDNAYNKKLEKAARQYLKIMIPDPILRDKLTPKFPLGCKKILYSDDYYQALKRPNVYLETNPIDRIEQYSIVTKTGAAHPALTIIMATGFETHNYLSPIRIIGRKKRVLNEQWALNPEAYLGMLVEGYPNFFVMSGPNTHAPYTSTVFMLECQARYMLQCIQACQQDNISSMEIKLDVVQRFNQQLQTDLKKTVWTGPCTSWYKKNNGRIISNWPSPASAYWKKTRTPNMTEFELR